MQSCICFVSFRTLPPLGFDQYTWLCLGLQLILKAASVLQLKFSFKVVLQLLGDEHEDSSEEDWIQHMATLERNGILIPEVSTAR